MIWRRYLLKEFLKTVSLVLFGFFFLYCAIDYSFHMQDFLKDKKIQLLDFFLYYGHLFIKRADLLISLSLLLGAIKVLTTLNTRRELLALQVAGLKIKTLIAPLIYTALLFSSFSLLSTEFMLPISTRYLDAFHKAHFHHEKRSHQAFSRKEKLQVIPLRDRSKVVYQYFDMQKNAYFDLIWIRSPDEIWRAKYLQIDGAYPQGEHVDHFLRNSEGFFEKKASFAQCTLTQLKWLEEEKAESIVPYENYSPSQLWNLSAKSTTTSYEKAEIMTHFYFKLAMPLMPLLVVIAASPFCVRYSRGQPLFFIYAFALFGYIAFYLFTNASVILGETNFLPPLVAIFAPFALCGSLFSWKFIKTS